ncbi:MULTISPECIES: cytochrome c biogenesis protein DipZ [unclassified Rhizobium]|uniref:cytochrome c biogenesis protein DipZ n=1 Tax=unclassified Rhizobium TaxID=2613769 RepID=UPI001ADA596A|nr:MULTISPECIES: cytochrome c biogenesis protein DipZ [unclassified Rhizobium]MBO9101138.1 cytochrome c biogenesis protein DipZ [Rhizobium sp. L58/93]MBO9168402.1 cytochrome c biogenesis protein DipZ [Rhizobium sp. L245/93]QXZ88203.1 cytochrome c biogenesis protein DipZ [Rhizobium sp. K1/93]QXZ94377.1 cytochrome c biogenesis protein DipZ [Rhizobium sp. K15/93]QYA05729.1 cytochrome c biogenesis protein DipZ [Rhizobium sp. B21/90]
MLLFLLAYLGGVLTIVSPCILPVLPFVFARAGQPFIRSSLPMLVGMAATFAAVATLAAFGGGWAVQANQYGRYLALALLAAFGIILLFPALSDYLTRPLVSAGARLSQSSDRKSRDGGSTVVTSLLLGVATGLLWAPCAGPVLGLILTGAALNGASVSTTLLLLAYALGAATSLALALLVGGRVYKAMKNSLGIGQRVRQGVGVAVLVAVVAIFFGADTGFLTQASLASTANLEQNLLDKLHPKPEEPSVVMKGGDAMMSGNNTMMMAAKPGLADALPIEGTMPPLTGAVEWLNSAPLTAEGLKGKVVLVDFWTYSCINCLRAIPYVKAWAEKYKDQGLVVIGVHAPEFAFEKDLGNVKKAIGDLGITYPVAIDNDYAIWRAFKNQYWPAHYFIDANGEIRHHHFGEGEHDQSERIIQQLLAEAGKADVARGIVEVKADGVQAAADTAEVQSPETYVGYARAENFLPTDGLVKDAAHDYQLENTTLNQWGLIGNWTVGDEMAVSNTNDGGIFYTFHARDLHLVLGPAVDGKPVRFQVTIDGKAPGESHGTDTDAEGKGTITGQRLYQLVRQKGPVADHTFQIKFLDPGVQAYAFTFG